MASNRDNPTITRIVIGCRQIILGGATWLWSSRIQILNGVKRVALGVLSCLLLFFVLAIFIVTAPRDVAYRNLHPATRICKEGLETGCTTLSEVNPKKAKAVSVDTDEELVDPSNDELKKSAVLTQKKITIHN